MQGKMKLEGSIAKAMKLKTLIDPKRLKAEIGEAFPVPRPTVMSSKPAYVGHDERPYEVEAYRLGKIKAKGVMGKVTRLKSLFKESNLKSKL
ncbi:hypothetical protein COOONC_07653 [Cooperia oncophora]